MEEHSHPHSHSISTLGIAGWLAIIILGGAGLWQLHAEIAALQMRPAASQSSEELKSQGVLLAALKVDIEQLRQTPPGTDPNLANTLSIVNAQLTTIDQRLQSLEAKSVTAPQAATNTAPVRLLFMLESKLLRGLPYSEELEAIAALPQLKDDAESIGVLRTFATSGAPTDLTLRAELDHILNAPAGDTKAAAPSRLSGLITIKRRPVTTEKTPLELPPEASITATQEKIAALSEEAKAPFADWLNTVAMREKALQATTVLQNKLLPLG